MSEIELREVPSPRAASIEQVRRGKDGKMFHVGGEVERALLDHDPNLRIRYSEPGKYYVVYYIDPETKDEQLVTTALDYDMRIVAKVIAIDSERYDLVEEIERIDKAADKEKDYRFEQQVSERGEMLHHAMRKDLDIRRIY